ncbi:molybdenum cofactor guanylyltransferase MobA [Microvirga solisilvae]|uniref:molybdenum cofactor guanylyltransferase MobA n=1 Tax=Microvirga solisilvae TaxID=2919498 RepID=UPI00311A9FAE
MGVILAGGLSRRMGGIDKTLLELGGQALLSHVVRKLEPQCESMIVNANGNAGRFAQTHLTVVPDTVPNHPGPLAGLLAAMEWTARNNPSIEWIVSVPGDTPFIPMDLVERLHAARAASRSLIACAASGSRHHFATGLWPVSLCGNLRDALICKGLRRVEDWVRLHGLATASWSVDQVDPFFNINTPEDLDAAESFMKRTNINAECGQESLDD